MGLHHTVLPKGLDVGECEILLYFGATTIVSIEEISMGSIFRIICHVYVGKIPASTLTFTGMFEDYNQCYFYDISMPRHFL